MAGKYGIGLCSVLGNPGSWSGKFGEGGCGFAHGFERWARVLARVDRSRRVDLGEVGGLFEGCDGLEVGC